MKTGEINFELRGIPVPVYSNTLLDFGVDNTSLSFTISNVGRGTLPYIIATSQDWITVDPKAGDVTSEADTIRVTINKTGLSDDIIYKEKIEITSTGGPDPVQDTIGIYLNGVLDTRDFRYYKIVRIGTQTWMAENLNVGRNTNMNYPTNNGILEKACYGNIEFSCETYGGLYDWGEAMQYNPSDTGIVGVTQGVCPNDWHMPTEKEWQILFDYLGGAVVAGGKLKETGFVHWLSPNYGATNESGFTALPGGIIDGTDTSAAGEAVQWSYYINSVGAFWTATKPAGVVKKIGRQVKLFYNTGNIEIVNYPGLWDFALSVRCIKDP